MTDRELTQPRDGRSGHDSDAQTVIETMSGDSATDLVDSSRAASILGIDVETFHRWQLRSTASPHAVAAALPIAIATNEGPRYRTRDVEQLGRTIAMSARAVRTKERGLGAYYTPDSAADLMARWAIRNEQDTVLEPSLGDGRFALAVRSYAISRGWGDIAIHACELDPDAATQAVVAGAVGAERLHIGDFLGANNLPAVDVVIGNPPYVRVRELGSDLRRTALDAAHQTMGAAMDKAGSVWLPFVSKSTTHLRPGGRLALVLPLDFTYVKYARPLWEFLARNFGRLRVLRFKERLFPDILQNVLILLADDKGAQTDRIDVIAAERLADLPERDLSPGVSIPIAEVLDGERAFQRALLPEVTRSVLEELAPHVERAAERVKFNIGYVSGNKTFFHPSAGDIEEFALPATSLRPTVASSRQLSQQGLATSQMPTSAYLWFPTDRLTPGERRYVEHGHQRGVDMAYKCRIRTPWYGVPGVKRPDLILTTFSDPPRLHRNDAGWVASNSVLCGYAKQGSDPDAFVSSWYTPLTLLSSELEIHSLGGGVMIAVPREADSVQVLRARSTISLDHRLLSSALSATDRSAAYAVGTSSISSLVGKDGEQALWEGIDVLAAWRRASSTRN